MVELIGVPITRINITCNACIVKSINGPIKNRGVHVYGIW